MPVATLGATKGVLSWPGFESHVCVGSLRGCVINFTESQVNREQTLRLAFKHFSTDTLNRNLM